MMFMALDTRPWTEMVKDMGGHPRVLADDMFLRAQGEDHVNHFVDLLNATHQYLIDMGAAIAGETSTIFSTSDSARVWLAEHQWPVIKERIKVVLDCRDLGAHICTAHKRDAETIT